MRPVTSQSVAKTPASETHKETMSESPLLSGLSNLPPVSTYDEPFTSCIGRIFRTQSTIEEKESSVEANIEGRSPHEALNNSYPDILGDADFRGDGIPMQPARLSDPNCSHPNTDPFEHAWNSAF
jgi:hypothetical protein